MRRSATSSVDCLLTIHPDKTDSVSSSLRGAFLRQNIEFRLTSRRSLLIVLAPALLAAAMYLLFGRIIIYVGEKHSIIRANRVGWIFIGFDILSFVIQVRTAPDYQSEELISGRLYHRRVGGVCTDLTTNRCSMKRRLFCFLASRFRLFRFLSSPAVSSHVGRSLHDSSGGRRLIPSFADQIRATRAGVVKGDWTTCVYTLYAGTSYLVVLSSSDRD